MILKIKLTESIILTSSFNKHYSLLDIVSIFRSDERHAQARQHTPALRSTPMTIMKHTLGLQACLVLYCVSSVMEIANPMSPELLLLANSTWTSVYIH